MTDLTTDSLMIHQTSDKEKDKHKWQKPLAESEKMVEIYSKPGQRVLDFCGGSFTNAEACYRTGRKFIGCDIDIDAVRIGQKRLDDIRLEREKSSIRPSEGGGESASMDIRYPAERNGECCNYEEHRPQPEPKPSAAAILRSVSHTGILRERPQLHINGSHWSSIPLATFGSLVRSTGQNLKSNNFFEKPRKPVPYPPPPESMRVVIRDWDSRGFVACIRAKPQSYSPCSTIGPIISIKSRRSPAATTLPF